MDDEPLDLPGEVWKPVDGFKGRYEVSDLGRVRALDGGRFMEAVLSGMEPPKLIRAQHTASNGYLTVSFTWARKVKTFHVHSLVCMTFLGARPTGHHAGHRNGDKTDNRLTNLRWVSPKENEADKREHGTVILGARHPGAKLSESQVRRIREMSREGVSGRQIAFRYGVSPSCVQKILNGTLWASLV